MRIDKVSNFKVYCVFNNGESRLIDFRPIFADWNLKPGDFKYPLLQKEVFETVALTDNTLSWKEVRKEFKLSNGKTFDVQLELDPVVLYDYSTFSY